MLGDRSSVKLVAGLPILLALVACASLPRKEGPSVSLISVSAANDVPVFGDWSRKPDGGWCLTSGGGCDLSMHFSEVSADPGEWDSFVLEEFSGEFITWDVLHSRSCQAKLYLRLDVPDFYLIVLLVQVDEVRSVSSWSIVRSDASLETAVQMALGLGKQLHEYYSWAGGGCGCEQAATVEPSGRCAPGTPLEVYERLERELPADLQEKLRGVSRPEDIDVDLVMWEGPARAVNDMWTATGLLGRRLALAGIPTKHEAVMLILFGFGRYLVGDVLDEHGLAAHYRPPRRRRR
jgi:hypothetical protein